MKPCKLFFAELGLLMLLYAQNANKVSARNNVFSHSAYGYMEKIGIPEAKRIRNEEENLLMPRIVGGETTDILQFNYQTGLLVTLENITGVLALCGGSLISSSKVATAAHCWFDGMHHGSCMTVVLGSSKLYSGGTRVQTCEVYTHPKWDPAKAQNDVAVINLMRHVTFSDTIAPIALPSKCETHEDFVGEIVIASGFGRIGENTPISSDQVLSKVSLIVISNEACSLIYPEVIHPSHICTNGYNTTENMAICSGDSGGPLTLMRKGNPILIGIASFGHPTGCDSTYPNGYLRVTSYLDFFKKYMNSNKN